MNRAVLLIFTLCSQSLVFDLLKMSDKILDDLAPVLSANSPLIFYRKQATFDWRRFRVQFHTEPLLALKMKIWRGLEQDPIFAHDLLRHDDCNLSREREVTFKRVQRLVEMNFAPFEEIMTNPLKSMAWVSVMMCIRNLYLHCLSLGWCCWHVRLVRSSKENAFIRFSHNKHLGSRHRPTSRPH